MKWHGLKRSVCFLFYLFYEQKYSLIKHSIQYKSIKYKYKFCCKTTSTVGVLNSKVPNIHVDNVYIYKFLILANAVKFPKIRTDKAFMTTNVSDEGSLH